jgi:hypothetical protein
MNPYEPTLGPRNRNDRGDHALGSPADVAGEPTADSKLLSQAIVFSTLLVCGVAIFAVVSFTGRDGYLPFLVFGFVVYLAVIKFLGD